MTATASYTVADFLVEDTPRALLPLDSTPLYVKHGYNEIREYVYNSILDKSKKEFSFLAAPVCYALKDAHHLRKLLCLDPISSFYIYDLVLRKAHTNFQVSRPANRRQYGYAFKRKRPLPPTDQYHEFRRAKYALKTKYSHFAKVDVSNCFNSFYHHHVAAFISDYLSDDDGEQAGQFLREINSGTSINCFPQGIYPAKTLGNFYLSFIETSAELRSPAIIRFLDDVILFSNNQRDVESDVVVLQQILGSHNLYLNSDKTRFGSRTSDFDERKIDAVKKRLLKKREEAAGYDAEDGDSEVNLEEAERDYIEQIIEERQVAEEDVELALSVIDEGATVVRLVELVCNQHPQLFKHLHRLFGSIEFDDDGASWEFFRQRVNDDTKEITEYELFWIAKILVDHYDVDSYVAELLTAITRHSRSTDIVKAIVLESTMNDRGFLEMKEAQVRKSPSSIAGIAALMGLRQANKSKRNHICSYAAKSGPHMNLYANIVKAM